VQGVLRGVPERAAKTQTWINEEIGMDRDDIDRLWQKALHQSVADGEQFTRYHFAALIAAKEREACANILMDMAERDSFSNYYLHAALLIRARGQA